MSSKRWRLGAVSFLNSLPLYRTLLDNSEVDVFTDLPANLAARLDAGECDAALMPTVDHLRGHGDGIVSDAIIGADGWVESVMLFSRVPVREIQRVAADTSSHTSVALLRVLLRDLYGRQVPFVDMAPNLENMLREADAALLIGDPALEAMQAPGELHVLDLAHGWKELTGLPFVFAAWTKRRGLENAEELGQLLNTARDEGHARLASIVAANPTNSPLPAPYIERYLSQIIQHKLTPGHVHAIEEFRRRLQLTAV